MMFLVNFHTNATRIGWHLWEIDFGFAPGLPLGWCRRTAGLVFVNAFLSLAGSLPPSLPLSLSLCLSLPLSLSRSISLAHTHTHNIHTPTHDVHTPTRADSFSHSIVGPARAQPSGSAGRSETPSPQTSRTAPHLLPEFGRRTIRYTQRRGHISVETVVWMRQGVVLVPISNIRILAGDL